MHSEAQATARDLAKRWQCTISQPLTGSTCSVVFAVSRNGHNLVLKVPFPHAEESKTGGVSAAFSAFGGVEILEVDEPTGAILMPRLGKSLDDLEAPESEKVRICANLIKRLRQCPSLEGVMSVAQYNDETMEDSPLRQKASKVANYLNETATETKLIHGDLHHYNILQGPEGWVAIDPKGLVGDPSFEVTGYMRNPIRVIDKDTLRLRLQIFHEELGDPIDRLWAWSFAQTAVCGLGSEGDFSKACYQTAQNLWEVRNEFGVREARFAL